MANLAQSAVTINDFWKEGGTSGRKFKAVDATLVLTGQGGLTNTIPAALFGLTKVVSVRAARDTASNQIVAGPSYDGASVVLGKNDGTGNPQDYNSVTVRLVVVGIG